MDEELKKNLSAVSLWIRLVYMVLFALILYVSMTVFWVIVVVQFLFALISGKPNVKLSQFSDVLSQYISQCLQFESFGSEDKPFPFADLPESSIAPEEVVESATEVEASGHVEPEEVEPEDIEHEKIERASLNDEDESDKPIEKD